MKPAPRPPDRRRPAAVTWLAAGVLTCAAFYLARLVLSLALPDLPLSVPEWYLPLTGAVWGGAALALGFGLLRGSRRAYRFLFWAVPIYLGWYWADRLLLVRSDFAQRSLPAALDERHRRRPGLPGGDTTFRANVLRGEDAWLIPPNSTS